MINFYSLIQMYFRVSIIMIFTSWAMISLLITYTVEHASAHPTSYLHTRKCKPLLYKSLIKAIH